MTTVTGLTAERMLQIEGDVVVDGDVVGGNLILTKNNGSTIDAGSVLGPPGPPGPVGPSGNETIGTSLPSSPVDGQRALLVDSLTVPSYAWLFRYVASITDAYKWMFEGGTTLGGENNDLTPLFDTGGTWQQVIGPNIVVPRNGIYTARVGCMFHTDAAIGNRQALLSICNASISQDSIIGVHAAGVVVSSDTITLEAGLTANGGQTLRLTVTGADFKLSMRWFRLTPHRVA